MAIYPLDLDKSIGDYLADMKEMDAPLIKYVMEKDDEPVAAFMLVKGEGVTRDVCDAADEAVRPHQE